MKAVPFNYRDCGVSLIENETESKEWKLFGFWFYLLGALFWIKIESRQQKKNIGYTYPSEAIQLHLCPQNLLKQMFTDVTHVP